jgi:hypothetical protein
VAAAIAVVATVVAAVVAVMMDVVVGFGSSFFCPAAAVAVSVVEITSAAKNEHKMGPDSLWIGPRFHPLAALAAFLAWPHIRPLVFTTLTGVTGLFPLHTLIINFVNGIAFYN